MNEKAVSPLIATIFLIAVSVALGSIVMSLGQDYVSQAGPSPLSCNSLNYDLKKVTYSPSISELKVVIDNGNAQIDGFLVKMFDSSYSGYTETVPMQVPAYEVGVISIKVDKTKVSEVYEVKVIPKTADEICDNSFRQVDQDSPLFTLI